MVTDTGACDLLICIDCVKIPGCGGKLGVEEKRMETLSLKINATRKAEENVRDGRHGSFSSILNLSTAPVIQTVYADYPLLLCSLPHISFGNVRAHKAWAPAG